MRPCFLPVFIYIFLKGNMPKPEHCIILKLLHKEVHLINPKFSLAIVIAFLLFSDIYQFPDIYWLNFYSSINIACLKSHGSMALLCKKNMKT